MSSNLERPQRRVQNSLEWRLRSSPNDVDAVDLVSSHCVGGRFCANAVDIAPVIDEKTGAADSLLSARIGRYVVDCVVSILDVPYHLTKGSDRYGM